jgi:photosystem II stability/assembly factor-like uncharacterized protein
MQTVRASLVPSLLLTLCLCTTISAQQAGRIESMKLLTPNVGWAATNKKLFWTNDGGAQWKDITPKLNHKSQAVSSVFFLDPSNGWVLLSCGDDRNPIADDVCFEFASTTNAGETWSVVHPKIVDPAPDAGFSGRTYLDFADELHGWVILKISTGLQASSGVMLRTLDGGKTWERIRHPPQVADHFHFVTATDGWLAGGPDLELYASRDAGDSWQRVELNAPKNISAEFGPVCDLPTFPDDKLGFLPVTYQSTVSSETTLVLFKTEDGGRTWHDTATLPAIPYKHSWSPLPSAVVKGQLVTAAVSAGKRIILVRSGRDDKTQSTEIPAGVSAVDALSLVGPTSGWILADHRLLRTTDAGLSWAEVTPGGAVSSLAAVGAPGKASIRSSNGDSALAERIGLPAAGSTVSAHLGFDTFPTPPQSTMQAWSNSSPYFDVGIYLYGSPNKSTNKSFYPTTQWLSTVEGQYGWGVISI